MADWIGQTFTDAAALPGEYVRHPPAASAHCRDGWPRSANFAMRLHQNQSVLANQNLRHGLWDVVGGALNQSDGWSGLVDGGNPGVSLSAISWSPAVARRYGPYLGIEDRRTTDGVPALRDVVVEVYCKSGATGTLTIYVALTEGLDPVVPYGGATLHSASGTAPTTAGFVTKTMRAPRSSSAATPLRCRPASTSLRGNAEARVLPYWLWVGWRATNAGDRVYAISAYEQR